MGKKNGTRVVVSKVMGRYRELKELRGKRGQGRKMKKQGDPTLPPVLQDKPDSSVPKVKSKIGGRIKQRVRKRTARMAMLKALQKEKGRVKAAKKSKITEKMEDDMDQELSGGKVSMEGVAAPKFSDENQSWLMHAKSTAVRSKDKSKTKSKKKAKKVDLLDGGSDGNGSNEEGWSCNYMYQNYLFTFVDF